MLWVTVEHFHKCKLAGAAITVRKMEIVLFVNLIFADQVVAIV